MLVWQAVGTSWREQSWQGPKGQWYFRIAYYEYLDWFSDYNFFLRAFDLFSEDQNWQYKNNVAYGDFECALLFLNGLIGKPLQSFSIVKSIWHVVND